MLGGLTFGMLSKDLPGELYRERRIADSVSGVRWGDRTVCSETFVGLGLDHLSSEELSQL